MAITYCSFAWTFSNPYVTFDGSFSLYRFSTFSEKMKKIYHLEVLMFCRIPFFLVLRVSVFLCLSIYVYLCECLLKG